MFIVYNLRIYFGFVEVVFCYLDHAGLEHMILLIQLSENRGHSYRPPHTAVICSGAFRCCLQGYKSIWRLSPGPVIWNSCPSSFSCTQAVLDSAAFLLLLWWGLGRAGIFKRVPQLNAGQSRTDSVWFFATEMGPQMVKQYNKGLTFFFTELLSWTHFVAERCFLVRHPLTRFCAPGWICGTFSVS